MQVADQKALVRRLSLEHADALELLRRESNTHTAQVCRRQHTLAYVSIRQHTSAYVSIRGRANGVCQGAC
jgi:hypothetical protein